MKVILKLSKTNCYLLPLPDGWLLVDTGYQADKELLLRKLRKLRLSPADIRFIFLTHHHDDHAGLLNELTQLNPSVRVIMHSNCAALLKEGINAMKFGGAWSTRAMKFAAELYSKVNTKWTLSFPPYYHREADIIVGDEGLDLEPYTGRKWKALYSPGHSPDHISLLDEHMNLFCGDAAANYLRILGTRYAPPFITDLAQFYATWQRFIDSGITLLYPSHGKPIGIDRLKKFLYTLRPEKMGKFTGN